MIFDGPVQECLDSRINFYFWRFFFHRSSTIFWAITKLQCTLTNWSNGLNRNGIVRLRHQFVFAHPKNGPRHQIIPVQSEVQSNNWHRIIGIESRLCRSHSEKCAVFHVWGAIYCRIGCVHVVRGKVHARLWHNIFCHVDHHPWRFSLPDLFDASEQLCSIHWKLRRIHWKTWVAWGLPRFGLNSPFLFNTGERSAIAYEELNGKIELLCKLFCFALFMTLHLMTISILLFTIVNYYIFDLGEESFYLVFSVVWVRWPWLKCEG